MRLVLLALCVFLTLLPVALSMTPPPVYEHKSEKNHPQTKCEACQATIKQLFRKIPLNPVLTNQKDRRKREQLVSDSMDKVCSTDNFGRYEFAPPTMLSGCNWFVKEYEEELEKIFFEGKQTDRDVRTKLCVKTKVCKALWSDEEEERKRDRSPEEAAKEQEEFQKQAKEAEKKKKQEEKEKKAAAKKKKAEAQKKKEEEAAAAAASDAKDEL